MLWPLVDMWTSGFFESKRHSVRAGAHSQHRGQATPVKLVQPEFCRVNLLPSLLRNRSQADVSKGITGLSNKGYKGSWEDRGVLHKLAAHIAEGPMRSLLDGSHDAEINEVIQAPRRGIMRPV